MDNPIIRQSDRVFLCSKNDFLKQKKGGLK